MRQNNVVHLGVVGHIAVERVVTVGAGVHGLFVTFTDIVEIHQSRRLFQILTD
jgi:hypothetical protein